ncbi:MAG: glycosyltransferase [Bacteroidetes bacterium]|nr:glycosyltransferase [Bacteroidota bacterium]
MRKVTVIICAYNEEKTIKEVIRSVSMVPIIKEIVVVNDGSTDKTKEIIEELKHEISFTAINLSENKGKGYAMALGVEHSGSDVLLFIDADQRSIPEGYINRLVSPILNNECDMLLGYTTVNFLNQEVNPFKILTGERCLFKKDLEPILSKMKESRFGIETLLYFYYLSLEKTLKFIHLETLKHNSKFQKMNSVKATASYINEGWEIAHTTFNNFGLVSKVFKNQIKNIKI